MKHAIKVMTVVLAGVLAACGSSTGGTDPTNPQPGGNAPVIASFTAQAATIEAGASTTLAWSTTGATTLTLAPGGDVTGTTSRVVTPAATTTYVLSAANEHGSVQRSVTVTVTTEGTGPAPTEITRLGLVMAAEQRTATGDAPAVIGFGIFTELPEATPAPTLGQYIGDMLDTCVVVTGDVIDPDPMPVPSPEGTLLDAGDVVTVRSSGTDLLELERMTFAANIMYGGMADGALPEGGLTIAIPGAEGGFPAFTAAFAPVADFALTQPSAGSAVTKTSTFTWTGTGANTVVTLDVAGMNAQNETVYVSCFAADDGAFTFPAATQAELDAAGFTTGSLESAGRNAYAVHVDGDSALVLVTAKQIDFLADDAD